MEWQRRWAFGLCITDTVVVCGSVLLGQYVRFGQTMDAFGYVGYYLAALSILFIATWLVALAALRTRSPRLVGTGIEEYRRVVAASFWTFGAIAIASLLLKLEIREAISQLGFRSVYWDCC